MMWSQEIVSGRLANVGEGSWSGDTFKASVIEIGERRLEGLRAARCLLEPVDHIPPAEAEIQYYRQLAKMDSANVT